MLQHHPAGAHPNAARLGENMRHEDFRRGTGQMRRAVVLGDPEAMITECLGTLRQPHSVSQGV